MKKRILQMAVLTLLIGFFAIDTFGQNFTNVSGGTYAVGANGGTIRMKDQAGVFDGTGQLGLAATRIPGTVEWVASCGNGSMTVQGLYYTNLTVTGTDAKTVQDLVHVSGEYLPDGGIRTYQGTFFYDGSTGTQILAGENGSNAYNNLDLSDASTKDVAAATTVEVTGTFVAAGGDITVLATGAAEFNGTADFTANLENNGDVTFGTGVGDDVDFTGATILNTGNMNLGAGIFTSNSNITNEGKFTMSTGALTQSAGIFENNSTGAPGASGIIIGAGAGVFTVFDLTNTDGPIDLANGSSIIVSNDFSRVTGALQFGVTSNFEYAKAGAVTIQLNDVTFPSYGNLEFSDATGAATAQGDVNVANILVTLKEIDMDPAAAGYELTMLNTNSTGDVTYTGGVETRGKFTWNNMAISTDYTMNNEKTVVNFDAVPTSYTLDVHQATIPGQANNVTVANEVNRRVVSSFSGGVNPEINSLVIGFEDTDVAGLTGQTSLMRFAEGFSAAAAHQRIIRQGAAYDRTDNSAGTWRSLTYEGGSGPGILLTTDDQSAVADSNYKLASGSDIILTTTPIQVISITNGRWSNPGTWDIGSVPTANDDVLLRTTVWTGSELALYNGAAWTDNEVDGNTAGDGGAAANSIVVDNILNSSLVVIGDDDDMFTGNANNERLFRTRITGGVAPTIINNNTNMSQADGDNNGASAGVNGIWIREKNGVNPDAPVLGTLTFTNRGAVTNKSIFEIGICN